MRKDSLVLTAGPTVLALAVMILTLALYFEVVAVGNLKEQVLLVLTAIVALAYVVQACVQQRWYLLIAAVCFAASALVTLDMYLQLYLLGSFIRSL